MGRVVTFSDLSSDKVSGVSRVPITQGETKEMAAELVRITRGTKLQESVPAGSDCYWFVLKGQGAIRNGSVTHEMPRQSFATVQEGTSFELHATDEDLELIRVLAPPPGRNAPLEGFSGGILVVQRDSIAIVDVPDQKKRRLYIVGPHAAASKRGHAMIVLYEKDTVTALHHHPDAESMFVLLDGQIQFTVNGQDTKVSPGQAAYFGMNDRHGLKVSDGHSGAAFLEFHIPAAFTTVKEQN